jgi:hypothetical protein
VTYPSRSSYLLLIVFFSNLVKMSSSAYASYRARIAFDPNVSSPALVSEGLRTGFFPDPLTRELLGLGDEHVLLHAGTYGDKEPGQLPTAYSLIRAGPPDRRLLPFVPQRYSDMAFPFSMHERNGQPFVHVKLLQARREELNAMSKDVLAAAKDIGRNPPHYLTMLIPRLTYHWKSDFMINPYQLSFPYQFQPYFSASANRARWIRIWRVLAVGQGYLNLCTSALGSLSDWHSTRPTGILLDVVPRDEDLPILRAYLCLGVPIEGDCPHLDLTGFTEIDALQVLLGPRVADVSSSVFNPSQELEPSDEDGLVWSLFNEGYDQESYDEYGYVQTRQQRRLIRAERATEELQVAESTGSGDEATDQPSSIMAVELARPLDIVPYDASRLRNVAPAARSPRQPPLRETSAGPSTPTSTSGQTTTSTSSRNAPSDKHSNPRRPRQNDRSRDFQGAPRAPKKRKGPRGSQYSEANSEPLGGTSAHYQPYSSARWRQDPAPAAVAQPSLAAQHELALTQAELSVPAPRNAPFRVGPALSARQSRELFRDTDTGTLHPMRVTEASFSSLGLSAGSPAPSYPSPSAAPSSAFPPSFPPAFAPAANWPPPSGPAGPSTSFGNAPSAWGSSDTYNAPASGWGSSDPHNAPAPSWGSTDSFAGDPAANSPPPFSPQNRGRGQGREPTRRWRQN